jgi:hypothetical protein
MLIIYSFRFSRLSAVTQTSLWRSTIRASDSDNGMFDDVVKGVRSDFKLEYSLKFKLNITPYNFFFQTPDTFSDIIKSLFVPH